MNHGWAGGRRVEASRGGGRSTSAPSEKWPYLVLLMLLVGWLRMDAAESGPRRFRMAGGDVAFEDVTARAKVRFAGMRWSRMQGAWQADVTVANLGSDPWTGRLLLAVEDSRGTSGPKDPDNLAGGEAGEPRFWDLSDRTGDGILAAGEVTRARTIGLGRLGNEAPTLVTRVYVEARVGPVEEPLAFTRVLDGDGRPLGGARVETLLPAGIGVTTSDGESGAVSLGGKPGEYRWRFEAAGHVPAWRGARLEAMAITKLPTPRLARRSGWVLRPETVAGWRESTNQIRVEVGAGSAGVAVEVTVLDGQSLPYPVPRGWSVQRAWWAESGEAWTAPLRVEVRTEDVFPETPTPVVLARFDVGRWAWQVVAEGAARGSDWVGFRLPGPGAYAVVSADAGTQGALPGEGAVLGNRATSADDVSGWAAAGRVLPGTGVASTNGALVRGMAELTVTNAAGALPSGTPLRAMIREHYRLADGTTREPMAYEASLTLRRRSGTDGAGQAFATFPLLPGLLMDAGRLEEARISAEILPEAAFAGGALGGSRGELRVAGLIVAGDVPGNGAARAVEVRVTTRTGGAGLAGFEVATGFGDGNGPMRLRVRFDPAPEDGWYVLGRRWYDGAETGLEPAATWEVRGGVVTESRGGGEVPVLPGVDRSGQYELVRVPGPVGIVTGTVRGGVTRGWAGISGTPWSARWDETGRFRLVAPPGEVRLVGTDLATGEVTSRAVAVPASGVVEAGDLEWTASAPFVAEVMPASGATDVGLLAPVVVRFSKAVRADPGAVTLWDARSNAVPARLAWEDGGRVARLIASNELAEASAHVVRVSSAVEDARGTRLTGAREFGFTTVARRFERAAGAQLTSEAPDADGEAWVRGSPGMAAPRQPVLFVNGTTGRTSSGFAGPDGSFAQRVPAEESDRLSVVVVHPDGTRSEYRVGRQLFPDGSVALFSEGGRITNRNDDLEVVLDVPAGAVSGRTKFKVTPLRHAELGAATKGTPPENGYLLAGFDLGVEGDPVSGKVRVEAYPVGGRWVVPDGERLEDATLVVAAFRELTEFADGVERTVPVYEYQGLARRAGGGAALQGTGARPQLLTAGLLALIDPVLARELIFGNKYYADTELIGQTTSALFIGGMDVLEGSDVPVGGAVVRARAYSQLNPRPFSLQGGEMVVTSGADGRFAFLVPEQTAVGGGHALTATHPAFPRQFATSGAGTRFDPLHPYGGGKIRFNREATPDVTGPSITVRHSPPMPAANQDFGVRVDAVDESGAGLPTLALDSVDPAFAFVNVFQSGPGFWDVRSDRPAKLVLRARATDSFGNAGETTYVVRVGDAPAVPAPVIDPLGPWVVYSQPDEGAVGVDPFGEFRLRFSEWVDPDLATRPGHYLTLTPAAGAMEATFDRDLREASLRIHGLDPGREYQLNLQGLLDVTGQYLDQNPATPAPTNEPFVLKFRTAPAVTGVLPGVSEGGGVVLRGAYAYVIDRREQTLNRYDVSIPARPVRLATKPLPGPPRALVLVPDYEYTLDFRSPGTPGREPGPTRRGDLLVVAGQTQGASWGYLRAFEIGETFEVTPHIAGAPVSMDETALLTRLTWSAPYLLLTENSAFAPQVHVINLQSFLLSDAYRALTPEVLRGLPLRYEPGTDANRDGDYVDAGDALPMQGRETVNLVAGEEATLSLAPNRRGETGQYQLESTSRYVTDALVDGPASMAVLVTTPGVDRLLEITWRPVLTNAWNRPTAVRAFVIGGDSPDTALPPVITNGYALEFPGWYPKRGLFVDAPLRRLLLLNLISLDNTTNSLRVIDASRPDFLRELGEIPLPVAEYGLLQGAERDDLGRVVLSTVRGGSVDLVLLDATKLLAPMGRSGVHPAILGRIAGAGAGSTPFAALGSGLTSASLRTLNVVSQGAPRIRLLPPGRGTADALAVRDVEERWAALRALEEPSELPVIGQGTNAALPGFDPVFRWHLMVETPGGAGATIRLAVASLGADGRLATGTNVLLEAYDEGVSLRRMSDDPLSPAFNAYVSGALALADDASDPADLLRLRGLQTTLRAGARVRAGIPESMASNPVLGPYAGRGAFMANPPPNAPPVRLGVALARPVSVLVPAFELKSPVVVRTTVDRVNGRACPGSAWLEFRVSPEAEVTIRIDGRPLVGGLDELGRSIPVFTNVSFTAGWHRVLVDSAHLPGPGEFAVEATATRFAGLDPGRTLTASGVIAHEVEMHHAFPVGHTVIQGVDLWDGHLTLSATDVTVPGRRLPLEFRRSYSSSGNATAGPLGAGWTHSANVRLVHDLACGTYTVVGGDGSGNAFVDPQRDAGRAARYAPLLPSGLVPGNLEFFKPQIGYHSTLVREVGRGGELWFFTKEGVRHHFVLEGSATTAGRTVYLLREIREPNGNALEFGYLEDGDPRTLDTVTELDATGALPKRGLRMEYAMIETEPRIVRLSGFNHQGSADLLGLEVLYRYDGWGNLTNVTRVGPTPAETRSESFRYTPGRSVLGHNLVEYVGPNGAVTRYEYALGQADPRGFHLNGGQITPGIPLHEIVTNVVQIGAARPGFAATSDRSYRFRYDFPGFLRYVTEPRAVDGDGAPIPETEYRLNIYGATVRIRGPLGQETEMRWATDHLDGSVRDENGLPVHDVLMTWRRDPEGQEQFLEYHDGRGNPTRERTVFTQSTKRPVTDAGGNPVSEVVRTTAYDGVFNQRTNVVDAEGRRTVHDIDPRTGNLVRSVDALGQERTFVRYPNGDLREERDERGFVTRYPQYDAYGNAARIVDGLGNETIRVHDELGRLRESRDAFGHHAQFEYDALDRRIVERHLNDLSGLPSGPDAETRTTYDAAGLVQTTRSALGLVTRVEYDALNREVRRFQPGIDPGDGQAVTYTEEVAYDAAGNLVAETDARGVTRRHVYDAAHRRVRTRIEGPFGGPNVADGVIARLAYDRAGNLTNEVDLHGFAMVHVHDGLYRIVETRLPFPGAVTTRRYDREGNVVRSTDPAGHATAQVYDALHRLAKVTDAEGRVVEFGYDGAGNRTLTMDRASGLETRVEYDALNREVSRTVKGPGLPGNGLVSRSIFNDARNEVVAVDRRGLRTRTRKDGLDRVAESVVDEGGLDLASRFTYDAAGNVRTFVDPEGGDVDRAYDYDLLGRRIRTTYARTADDAGLVEERAVYDPAGSIVRATNRRGIETRHVFDNLRRPVRSELRETISDGGAWLTLTSTTYDDARNEVSTTDAAGRVSRVELDALGRPRRSIDPLGGVIHQEYGPMDLLAAVDRRGIRTEWEYDRLHRRRVTREFDEAGRVLSTVRTAYEDAQRRMRTTDRAGRDLVTESDALGRPRRVLRTGPGVAAAYGTDPLVIEERDYDAAGNLTRIVDGDGRATEFAYDGANRVTNVVEGAGSQDAGATTTTYNRAGHPTTIKDPRAHGGGFDVRYDYDARYRRIGVTDALGNVTRYHYDAGDNLTRVVDPLGYETRYEHDELGALLTVDESSRATPGSADAGVTRYRYDALRNRVAQQDAVSNLVTYAYDALNRRTNVWQHALPGVIGADPRRGQSFGGGTPLSESTAYDAMGHVTNVVDTLGQRVAFVHDALGRMTERRYAAHAELAAPGVPRDFQPLRFVYAYDANGNLTECVEEKVLGGATITERTVMAYDPLDRVIARRRFDRDDAVGRVLAFGYDVAGNRTNLVDTDGRRTGYTYDARNRLRTVTMDAETPRPNLATYTWQPDGLLRAVALPGGATSERAYDAADRLVGLTNRHPSVAGVLSAFTYQYDANGNRTRQTEVHPALGVAGETTTYRHDRMDRVTEIAYGAAGTVTTTYDAVGNRLTETGTDPVDGRRLDRAYVYGPIPARAATTFAGVNLLSRIEDRADPSRTIDFEYDAGLNQVARVQGNDRREFRYDIRGQLIAATVGGATTRFDYTYERSRGKKVPGTGLETRYLHDGAAVAMEYGGAASAHATRHTYDHGMGLLAFATPVPDGQGDGGGPMRREYYLGDAQGSTRHLIDGSGRVAADYRYDAWGRRRAKAGTSENPREYTGHFRDDETGLQYFGARYYDDEQGRFLTQDPRTGDVGQPRSLHRFVHAYANPMRYVDPTGFAPASDSDGGDKWLKEAKKELREIEQRHRADIAKQGADALSRYDRAPQLAEEMRQAAEERKRMLEEAGLTEGALANPVLADRAKWGLALLQRDLVKWSADGDGGKWRAVVAAAVVTGAAAVTEVLTLGAIQGTISGKLDVGEEVTAGEWVQAGLETAGLAGGGVRLVGKIGASGLARNAAKQAAAQATRGAVIQEARRSLSGAAADAARLLDDVPRRVAHEREFLALSRELDESARVLAAERRMANRVATGGGSNPLADALRGPAGLADDAADGARTIRAVIEPKTVNVHADFLQAASRARADTDILSASMRLGEVRVQRVPGLSMTDADGNVEQVWGLFRRSHPEEIQVRAGLSKAEDIYVRYHETYHAYSYATSPRQYAGTEAFVEEFFAHLRGVQGEIRELGLNATEKTYFRTALEDGGLHELAVEVYRGYRSGDKATMQFSWGDVVEALKKEGVVLR